MTVPASETAEGELWTCEVLADDGQGGSVLATASELIVPPTCVVTFRTELDGVLINEQTVEPLSEPSELWITIYGYPTSFGFVAQGGKMDDVVVTPLGGGAALLNLDFSDSLGWQIRTGASICPSLFDGGTANFNSDWNVFYYMSPFPTTGGLRVDLDWYWGSSNTGAMGTTLRASPQATICNIGCWGGPQTHPTGCVSDSFASVSLNQNLGELATTFDANGGTSFPIPTGSEPVIGTWQHMALEIEPNGGCSF